jgi:di/tricarboxylate transporter
MNIPLILTFLILIAAVALLISDRLRADLVALLVAVALGVTGVLSPQEAFAGFSRSAVITIMAIFILAEGLRRTGVTEQVGNLLLRAARASEPRLAILTMLAGAFLSLFMNNIAAASVLLPAVASAGRKVQANPSRLMMPLAFSTMLGGTATLFATTNIVVSSLLRDQGLAGFGVLDFAPVGLPLVATGILYMALWGRRRLPIRPMATESADSGRRTGDLVDIYNLDERLFRARVPDGSYLLGKPLADSTFREKYGVNVVAIERDGRLMHSPPPDFVFRQGDTIVLEGKLEEFRNRDVEPYLEILSPRKWREHDLESSAVVVVEVMVAPRSSLIGQTLREAHFRDKYGMNVLAIWREGRAIRTGLADLSIQFGDALLLQGARSRLSILDDEPNLIVLSEEERMVPVAEKGWPAILIMALTLLFATIFAPLVGEIMLGGALLMILINVLTMDQVYRAIEWRTVFLIAGMLPLGTAMARTGAAALLADGLTTLLGPAGPLALLAGFVLLTVLLAQAMSGAVVAAVMAPIAITAAQNIGANPRALAMGVALATSMTFITPLGHPVNVLVMGVGGYRFSDYARVGLPLTLLLFVALMLILPIFWPLAGS